MTKDLIGSISLYDLAFYFIIFGFLGWCAEVVYSTLKTGKFINRGFLNGPVCSIYGFGMAISVLFLNTIADKWYLLFLVGGAFASLIELLTGIVLEKIFKTRWWDYSKEPFNLKGYICLRFSILWGITVLLMFKTLVPLTDMLIGVIPIKVGYILLIMFGLIYLSDFICTLIQLKRVKNNVLELTRLGNIMHEGSDMIGKTISEVTVSISEKISEINEKIKSTRLGKAFPNIIGGIEEKGKAIKEKVEEKFKKK